MKRAVVLFVEKKKNMLEQFFCFYTSYKYINSKDTDLVVFAPKDTLPIIPNDCIKIAYESISNSGIWNGYHFINSLSCLKGPQADFLFQYDLILRSDVDSFLTPAWNHYYPNLYSACKWGYANDELTFGNLKKIARDMGLRHQGIHNIGTAHYGNAHLVLDVARLAIDVGEHILKNYFKDNEGRWPSWYRGVTSMYANEIAANHVVDCIELVDGKLDYSSTSLEHVTSHPHIHCYHTHEPYSKFSFGDGKYDYLKKEIISRQSVAGYCMYIALLSKELYGDHYLQYLNK